MEATTGESVVANTVEDFHAAQQKRITLRKERLAAEKYEAEQQHEWEDEERVKEAGHEVDRQYKDFENEHADILYPQSPKLDRKKGKPPADGKSKRMPDGPPPSSPAKVTHKGCPVEVSRKSKKKNHQRVWRRVEEQGGRKRMQVSTPLSWELCLNVQLCLPFSQNQRRKTCSKDKLELKQQPKISNLL